MGFHRGTGIDGTPLGFGDSYHSQPRVRCATLGYVIERLRRKAIRISEHCKKTCFARYAGRRMKTSAEWLCSRRLDGFEQLDQFCELEGFYIVVIEAGFLLTLTVGFAGRESGQGTNRDMLESG